MVIINSSLPHSKMAGCVTIHHKPTFPQTSINNIRRNDLLYLFLFLDQFTLYMICDSSYKYLYVINIWFLINKLASNIIIVVMLVKSNNAALGAKLRQRSNFQIDDISVCTYKRKQVFI